MLLLPLALAVGFGQGFGPAQQAASPAADPARRALGASVWGASGHIEYLPGDAPLVISAPHGGTRRPAEIADRRRGVRLRDVATLELARSVAAAFHERTGERPHLVLCHLHRVKLDANRELPEAASEDPAARRSWREFHAFIEEARAAVRARHGAGLYVDLHGQSHPEEWVELGYLLPARVLALPDAELSAPSPPGSGPPSSLRALAARSRLPLAALVRGEHSLGALLEARGHATVPSPAHPHPAGGNYYSGGYDTRRHGSAATGTVDGLQVEVPRSLRRMPGARETFARDLAGALQDFLVQHYAFTPAPRGAGEGR